MSLDRGSVVKFAKEVRWMLMLYPTDSMVIEIEEEVSWEFGGGWEMVLLRLFGGIFGGMGEE
jgi:hypothetical protein